MDNVFDNLPEYLLYSDKNTTYNSILIELNKTYSDVIVIETRGKAVTLYSKQHISMLYDIHFEQCIDGMFYIALTQTTMDLWNIIRSSYIKNVTDFEVLMTKLRPIFGTYKQDIDSRTTTR